MLTYVGTLHTCRRLSLDETATAFQADRVAFCKQTDFNGGPYRPLHDGGVGAGSQPMLFWAIGASFSFPRGMFSEVDVGFASSLHTLCSRHVDPPELLHLADSSPMHGRNVALVAAMNSPTTYCNVNYVWTKWALNIMSAELSIIK